MTISCLAKRACLSASACCCHTLGLGARLLSVQGTVKRVEKFGAFVAVSGADLSGLVHLSELSDDFVKDPTQHLQPGQCECRLACMPNDIHAVLQVSCARTVVILHQQWVPKAAQAAVKLQTSADTRDLC